MNTFHISMLSLKCNDARNDVVFHPHDKARERYDVLSRSNIYKSLNVKRSRKWKILRKIYIYELFYLQPDGGKLIN